MEIPSTCGGLAKEKKISGAKEAGTKGRSVPWTNIFSTSLDQTSLPSLRSLWCLRCGVRFSSDSDALSIGSVALEAERERADREARLRRRGGEGPRGELIGRICGGERAWDGGSARGKGGGIQGRASGGHGCGWGL